MKDNFLPPCPLITPVLFMTFERPGTTKKVFESIRQAQPKRLYIAQNFPSSDNTEEIKKWKDVRAIIENIDWNCDVRKLYRERYLDVKTSVSSAIDWFFENVEEGIILEDDCLPSQSFFWFCQELLEYYRDDTRIMTISGTNFQFGKMRGEGSYYFSKYVHAWGWAGWRRSWRHYDVDIKSFEKFKTENRINNIFRIKQQQKYWTKVFQLVHEGKIDTWDYQWAYSCFINNGLCIMPNVNLVSNIGFGIDSTHTQDENSIFSKIKGEEITEIVHPEFVLANQEADLFTSKVWFGNINIFNKIKNKVLRIIGKKI